LEPGRRQRRATIVGAGTPAGGAVAPDHLRFTIAPSCEPPFDGAHATDVFCENLLRMAVSLIDWLGCFAQVMKVTQLVRHLGSGLGDRRTDGPWPIGNDAPHRHLQGLLHLTQQRGSVVVGGRQ
jgi:hypothetical protein